MSTVSDIIRRSLKLLGVLAAGESLSAEDQADGLVELNVLLSTWSNDGLPVYGPWLTTDTPSLPSGFENALGHALALQIAPMYGVEPSALLVQNAADTLASIKRSSAPRPANDFDLALLSGGPFNLVSGDA